MPTQLRKLQRVLVSLVIVGVLASCSSEQEASQDWVFLPPLDNQIYKGSYRLAYLEAVTAFDDLRNNYQLVFHCDKNGIEMFVNWYQYLGYEQDFTVDVIKSSGDPTGFDLDEQVWRTGLVEPYYTFYPGDASGFSENLVAGESMNFVLEVNPDFDRMAIFIFPDSTNRLDEFIQICSDPTRAGW